MIGAAVVFGGLLGGAVVRAASIRKTWWLFTIVAALIVIAVVVLTQTPTTTDPDHAYWFVLWTLAGALVADGLFRHGRGEPSQDTGAPITPSTHPQV